MGDAPSPKPKTGFLHAVKEAITGTIPVHASDGIDTGNLPSAAALTGASPEVPVPEIPQFTETRHIGAHKRATLPTRKELHQAQEQEGDLPHLRKVVTRGFEARHLLGVPPGVDVMDVANLAMARFKNAHWKHAPETVEDGRWAVMALSRHSTISGPFTPAGAGLPTTVAQVYDVVCPRERWKQAPMPELNDRLGFTRAFPLGLPTREGERILTWMIAAARRLGGSVRMDIADHLAGKKVTSKQPGLVLTPDPDRGVSLTVFSPVWLDPQACHAVVLQQDQRATLAVAGANFAGPAAPEVELPALDDATLAEIHAKADEFDRQALAKPTELTGYGITICLDEIPGTPREQVLAHPPTPVNGWITVEVHGDNEPPAAIQRQPWAAEGCIAYRVRWDPIDLFEANSENPGPAHTAARRVAAQSSASVAKAIWSASGGVIADEWGFLIAPQDL